MRKYLANLFDLATEYGGQVFAIVFGVLVAVLMFGVPAKGAEPPKAWCKEPPRAWVVTVAEPTAERAARLPDYVHSIAASRVLTNAGQEIQGWRLHFSLMRDVGPDGKVGSSIVVTIGQTPLYLNGVLYDPSGAIAGMDPHTELLGWWSLNGVFKIEEKGGGYNVVTLKGEDRNAHCRNLGCEWTDPRVLANRYDSPSMAECRRIWATTTGKTACPNCTACANGCGCFGGGYYCGDGKCPVTTPSATNKPDLVTTDGRTIRWAGDHYEFVGQSACPNGKCNLKR